MTEPAEVAIVGGGPIGLEMHAALRARGVECLHFEAGQIGATMGWWAPGTRYFSSPERLGLGGVPLITLDQSKATREEYLAYLRGFAQQFRLPVRTYERVERIERIDDGFLLRTARSVHGVGGPEELERARRDDAPPAQWEHRARRVVLAIGDMHQPRTLGVPGEDLPHVSHFLDDPHKYYGRRLLIVGGKNSAAEAAIRCWRAGAEVAISYRRDEFDPDRIKYWLLPELKWLIEKGRIGWHPRTAPVRITPGHAELAPTDDWGQPIDASTETPASNGESGGSHAGERVPADFVLLLTGYVQDPSLFEQLGVELVGAARAPKHDRETMETNVPGVYVAGTATAGTQSRARVFIETSHVHVDRIVAAVAGAAPDQGSLQTPSASRDGPPIDPDYGAMEES